MNQCVPTTLFYITAEFTLKSITISTTFQLTANHIQQWGSDIQILGNWGRQFKPVHYFFSFSLL